MNTTTASRATRRSTAAATALATAATAAAAAGALAVAAAPAHAGPHSITLAGPASGTLGQSVVVTASGFVGTDPYGAFTRYINAYVIPSNVLSTCPATVAAAMSAAAQTAVLGGDTIAAANTLPMGSFSAPLVWMPQESGTFIVCAYMHRYESNPDAVAQHVVAVGAASSSGGSGTGGTGAGGGGGTVTTAPVVTSKPGLRRQGRKLACSRGSWGGSPAGYRYAWKVGKRIVPRATGTRLTITSAVRGKKVRCRVTARNAAGSASAWSRAVRVR